MATTHDCTSYSGFVGTAAPWGETGNGFGNWVTLKFVVDFSALASYLSATLDGSASDVIQVWDIPVGTQILSVWMEVITAEGATATMAVGDANSAAGFLAATTINTAGTIGASGSTDTWYLTCGKCYTATDTLDITLATAADVDAAVVNLYVNAIMIPELAA